MPEDYLCWVEDRLHLTKICFKITYPHLIRDLCRTFLAISWAFSAKNLLPLKFNAKWISSDIKLQILLPLLTVTRFFFFFCSSKLKIKMRQNVDYCYWLNWFLYVFIGIRFNNIIILNNIEKNIEKLCTFWSFSALCAINGETLLSSGNFQQLLLAIFTS